MPTFQKIALGVVGVAIVATLVYPTHKTSNVINAFGGLSANTLIAAEGL